MNRPRTAPTLGMLGIHTFDQLRLLFVYPYPRGQGAGRLVLEEGAKTAATAITSVGVLGNDRAFRGLHQYPA